MVGKGDKSEASEEQRLLVSCWQLLHSKTKSVSRKAHLQCFHVFQARGSLPQMVFVDLSDIIRSGVCNRLCFFLLFLMVECLICALYA